MPKVVVGALGMAECPIPSTEERLEDTHFFLHEMLHQYHLPGPFRWALHAFVQALRSLEDVGRGELEERDADLAWFTNRWEEFRRNDRVAGFLQLRDGIVKRASLLLESTVRLVTVDETGAVHRIVDFDTDPADSSFVVLHRASQRLGPTSDGVYAITRAWRLAEIGDELLLDRAHEAWGAAIELVSEIHARFGFQYEVLGPGETHGHGHGDVATLVADANLEHRARAAGIIDETATFDHVPLRLEQEYPACPLPMTHDRLEEAHYYLDRLLSHVHEPEKLRAYLNAFLQALRSVTFLLQAEGSKISDFDAWYATKRAEMEADPALKRLADARVIVVHRASLAQKSHIQAGLFRGRRLKLAVGFEVDVNVPSEVLLRRTQVGWGDLLDEEHSAIGEQYGVMRDWRVPDLDEGPVLPVLIRSWEAIARLVREAHERADGEMDLDELPRHEVEDEDLVLLESDVDPVSLPRFPGQIVCRDHAAGKAAF